MKTEFSTIALLLCVAALATVAVTGVMYVQRQGDRESLDFELAAARTAIEDFQGNATILEQRLAVAEDLLAEEQRAMEDARVMVEQAYSTGALSSGEILGGVLSLAQDSRLDVVEITTEPEETEVVADLEYSVLSIDLRVMGGLLDLSSFVGKLEKGVIKAVSVDEITIEEVEGSYVASVYFSVLYPRL